MLDDKSKLSRFELTVEKLFHRKRLDEFLFVKLPQYSKACIRAAVRDGLCEINGELANRGILLRENDFVEFSVEQRRSKAMAAQQIPLDIIYEDASIIAVNKQYGILVHPTHMERDGTLLNGLSHYLNRKSIPGIEFVRPHLVHRLDRETSGVMIVAKDTKSAANLARQIKKHRFKKKYLAEVEGVLERDSGTIDKPVYRDPELKRHLVSPKGKHSLSRYSVVSRGGETTLLELEPVSGRTNQLRIHCSSIGHPIVGDIIYGANPADRIRLHASGVWFRHPTAKYSMAIRTPDPDFAHRFMRRSG
ncbi:MAG: RluA family pseudouridine synthase [Pyrinomonadaceae bacterium]